MAFLEKPARPPYTSDWLFHRTDFLKAGTNATLRSYYQFNKDEVLICLRCMLQGSTAWAAPEGLYGCMELKENAHPAAFLEYVRNLLHTSGINRLSLTLFPEAYDSESWKKQQEALEADGFTLEGSIEHRLIAVTAEENELLASSDWRLEDSHLTEFSVTEEPLPEYEKIKKLVGRADTEEGVNGKANLAGRCFDLFPEQTHIFAVREGVKYCALGVFLEAGPGILYALEIIQLEEVAEKKPALSLLQFVYEWAELHEYRYIDLGQISMGTESEAGLVRGTGERWTREW